MRVIALLLSLIAAGLTSACATVTTGTDQSVIVETTPQGAACQFSRGGATVATVNPTPGSIILPKSKYDVMMVCQKNGFENASAVLTSTFQGATLGNAILGGLIGIAIDASSGAANKYPDNIKVRLMPVAFRDEEDRDAFFAIVKADIQKDAEQELAKAERDCQNQTTPNNSRPDPQQCDAARAKVEEARDSRIKEMDSRLKGTRIDPNAPPIQRS